eukprot:TRINITY_DN20995_c0_g1_i1.p1 TRINITY_DN20995_c0_g1~~TRINITY_DN20995_c0_g1_i1.p1  ORF type:complete len:291 (+),score=56.97 TRINITY_DN20995_c0_g1_i1:120-875(+)
MTFDHGPAFRKWLLAKMINAEIAAMEAPQIAAAMRNARNMQLESLVRDARCLLHKTDKILASTKERLLISRIATPPRARSSSTSRNFRNRNGKRHKSGGYSLRYTSKSARPSILTKSDQNPKKAKKKYKYGRACEMSASSSSLAVPKGGRSKYGSTCELPASSSSSAVPKVSAELRKSALLKLRDIEIDPNDVKKFKRKSKRKTTPKNGRKDADTKKRLRKQFRNKKFGGVKGSVSAVNVRRAKGVSWMDS